MKKEEKHCLNTGYFNTNVFLVIIVQPDKIKKYNKLKNN